MLQFLLMIVCHYQHYLYQNFQISLKLLPHVKSVVNFFFNLSTSDTLPIAKSYKKKKKSKLLYIHKQRFNLFYQLQSSRQHKMSASK